MGAYYADKTRFLYEIAIPPDPFFLDRPPGFGKNILVSSLERSLLWVNGSSLRGFGSTNRTTLGILTRL
jgi:hypothetical protein